MRLRQQLVGLVIDHLSVMILHKLPVVISFDSRCTCEYDAVGRLHAFHGREHRWQIVFDLLFP